jgi:hypothetical protein
MWRTKWRENGWAGSCRGRGGGRTEEIAPLVRLVQLVRVVEGVSRLVAQVEHDFARVLEVVHFLLEPGELGVGEVERDADDGLSRRASPFVRQVAERPELLEPLALELPVELLDKPFERRALQLQAELLDGLGEDFLDVRGSFFESLQATCCSCEG